MSELDRIIRANRFRSNRFPGFESVPGDTTGNIPPPDPAPPTPSVPVPATPATPLAEVFAFDDTGGVGIEDTGAPAGPAGPGVAPGEPSFGLDLGFDAGAATRAGLLTLATTLNPALAAVFGIGTGVAKGTSLTGQNIGVGEAEQPGPGIAAGLATGSPGFTGVNEQGISVGREGTGVATSGADVGPAPDPTTVGAEELDIGADIGAAEGEPGPSEADVEASGGAEPGADDAGDDEGGGPSGGGEARSGGPIVASAPGGRQQFGLHDGEFVLQAEMAQTLGEDALNLLNSGDFNPAAVRGALGLSPQVGASFQGGGQAPSPVPPPGRPTTALNSVR